MTTTELTDVIEGLTPKQKGIIEAVNAVYGDCLNNGGKLPKGYELPSDCKETCAELKPAEMKVGGDTYVGLQAVADTPAQDEKTKTMLNELMQVLQRAATSVRHPYDDITRVALEDGSVYYFNTALTKYAVLKEVPR